MNEIWPMPPIVKVYEAIGAVADGRLEIDAKNPNMARVYSSNKSKFYTILYNEAENAIMCNDSATYYQGYLGYPGIAFLLQQNILPYNAKIGNLLKGITWKDIAKKLKNNWDQVIAAALETAKDRGGSEAEVTAYAEDLYAKLEALKLKPLGKKMRPPLE